MSDLVDTTGGDGPAAPRRPVLRLKAPRRRNDHPRLQAYLHELASPPAGPATDIAAKAAAQGSPAVAFGDPAFPGPGLWLAGPRILILATDQPVVPLWDKAWQLAGARAADVVIVSDAQDGLPASVSLRLRNEPFWRTPLHPVFTPGGIMFVEELTYGAGVLMGPDGLSSVCTGWRNDRHLYRL